MSEYSGHVMEQVMDCIIALRYTDLEEERRLCTELLRWAGETKDTYAFAFAHTYLGDCEIAQNNSQQAGLHLMTAKGITKGMEHVSQLLLRIYSLLGVNYENLADEQNSVQYHLMAMTMAREEKDILTQCIVLNNLAFAFQRHQNHEEASRYYREAYLLQRELPELQFRAMLIGNLVELSLILGQYEEALSYMEECLLYTENDQEYQTYEARHWCCYYCAVKDFDQASFWAEKFLKVSDYVDSNRLSAFESYGVLCEGMLSIHNQFYAKEFLERMEATIDPSGLNQLIKLEEIRMKYILQYEKSEKHTEAYRMYYQKNQEFQARINQNMVIVMKAKLDLDNLMQQQEEMRSEFEDLERQANMDELTDIYNRRYLEQLVQKFSEMRDRKSLGVIMLDVDYFKEYNDFYGHMTGDIVLKTIGSCLQNNTVEGIYPCRYGGDEFACVCYGITPQEAKDYADRVCEDLRNRHLDHKKSRCSNQVTLSIGCAIEEPGNRTNIQSLQQLADEALYESKAKGRNTYTGKRVG